MANKNTTHLQNRRVSRGRHPLLKNGSTAFEVYYDIKRHPATSKNAGWKRTHLPQISYVRALNRLLGEGLIVERRRGFSAVPANEAGYARDRVSVEIIVYVNKYGEYSARANLAGQLHSAVEDNPVPVHSVEFTFAVPKPTEPSSTKAIFGRGFTGVRELAKNPQGLIIDAKPVSMAKKRLRSP